ncbi:MAG: AAA domain-containing protein [Bacteroidota bacterium]
MRNQQVGTLLFKQLQKIHENATLSQKEKVEALYNLLSLAFVEATKDERVLFTTLFARISFASQRFQIPKQTRFFIHHFRIKGQQVLRGKQLDTTTIDSIHYPLGLKAVSESIKALFDVNIPADIQNILPPKGFYKTAPAEVKAFRKKMRVVALADDADKEQLVVQDQKGVGEELRVQYNIAERNENFNPTIRALKRGFEFPVVLNLLDVEIDKSSILRPKAFVIEPDYLMDVTAVAECFKDTGTEALLHLLKRFMPFESSVPLMLGNIANYFLDELMTQPERTFKELFPPVFQLNPLAFTLFDDRQVKEIYQKSQKHYVTLKQMVLEQFEKQEIEKSRCYIEPSFYSETYGLQGRLDVFYQNKQAEENGAAIIELKSGKVYRPNRYGISHNHYTQTLLYDLLIRSAYGEIAPINYILYSASENRPLRFAPTIRAQQYEAIQVRNQLVAIEQGLINLKDGDLVNPPLLRHLHPDRFPQISGFLKRNLLTFSKTFFELTVLERKYFTLFTSFIAREHRMAKMGIHGAAKRNGQAAIWLDTYKEKEDNFNIISHLKLDNFQGQSEDPFLHFLKTEKTNNLANFRRGDIAVLYPFRNPDNTPLQDQVFKCTVIQIDNKKVVIRLRSKQFNTSIFEEDIFWNIEHDLLDSGYTNLYRGLFAFAETPIAKRALLLGQNPPRMPEKREIEAPTALTLEQQSIYKKIINARDYFLLWGPPGTGKTSMMLKYVVKYLWQQTDQNILLMAYTNRAVDEICEAIEQIDEQIKADYIRIGSRFSTNEKFSQQLLDYKLNGINTRKDLQALLLRHRIFVGTVNGISGKKAILKLKTFHQVIIDEASQLLEPYLVGLLPHFQRFVLIGDHQQLPAVVQQSPEESTVEDVELKELGLNNLRDSFFERIYKQCLKKGWHWAHAQLSHQGRMHQDIMHFPNQFFYQKNLKILPSTIQYHHQQLVPLNYQLPDDPTFLEHLLCSKRVVYLDTEVDERSKTHKTNQYEALKLLEIIQSFQTIYQKNNLTMTANSIGIITPYRAQIAQIRQQLLAENIDVNALTIDTVERYQGGARDIILISLCTNNFTQLDSLVSLSEEGVDRRLNVALTRARKHLVILGNKNLLLNNPTYKDLIESLERL